jgi:hypothetical protein
MVCSQARDSCRRLALTIHHGVEVVVDAVNQ